MDYNKRKIRVFLSSTFRDMNNERDYLVRYIFPRVHEYCRKRDLEFYPIDLRWGITEEQSKSGLVLNACLNEIDDSRPFFVGILGMRYGWIPSIDELDSKSPSLAKESDWILNQVIAGKSITEMEMEYAVLRDMQMPHASFFIRSDKCEVLEEFREQPKSENAKKLALLKNKIYYQKKYPVYTYESIKDMGELLYSQLIQMIDAEYPVSCHEGDQAIIAPHETSLLHRSQSLCEMPTLMENFQKWIESLSKILIMTGDSGMGVSTSFAYGITQLRNKYDGKILYFDFDSLPPQSNPIECFHRFMDLEENHFNPEKWGLLALDNLTSLSIPELNDLSEWIYDQSTNLHIAMSMTESSPAYDIMMYRYKCPSITVHGMSKEMTREFIENYIVKYGKQLTELQKSKIINSKRSGDPTSLILMLDAIVAWGDYEKLDNYIDNIIKYSDSNNLFWSLLKEVEMSYAHASLGKEFAQALIAISLAPEGISEQIMMSSLGLSQAAWSAVKPGVLRFCKGNDDRLMLTRPAWRNDIKMHWDTNIRAQIGKRMTKWFTDDEVRAQHSCRTLASIYDDIWHLPFTRNGDKDDENRELDEYKGYVRRFIYSYRNIIAMSPGMRIAVIKDDLRNGSFVDSIVNETKKIIKTGSVLDTCNYVQTICRTLCAFQYGDNSVHASNCFAQLAKVLQNSNNPLSCPFKALSLISIGKAKEALLILESSNLLPVFGVKALFKKKRKFEGEMFIAHVLTVCIQTKVYILLGDWKKIQQSINYIMETVDFSYLRNSQTERALTEIVFSVLCESLMSMAMFANSEMCNDINQMLKEWEDIIANLGIGTEAAYYHSMTRAIIFLRSNNPQGLVKTSYYALKSAMRVFGVNNQDMILVFNSYSLQYNRAANLYAIAYFKLNNIYRNWHNRSYKRNFYEMMESLRKFSGINWPDVDLDVRKQAYREEEFYTLYVNSIQPESKKNQLQQYLQELKTQMSL